MRILLGFLLLAAAAAWAEPDGQDRDIAAAKEKLQAMLDEAALLEKAGHRDEAEKVREEAAALKRKIEEARGRAEDGDAKREPLHEALHRMEQAIGALDKAGYEGLAGELRASAEKLRMEIRRRDAGQQEERAGKEMDALRRNLDTLRIALKGLKELDRHDAAELVGRAIHARELMVAGKPDEAERAMKEGPDDRQLAELLLTAAGCWRELKQPDNAGRCEELRRFLERRAEEQMRVAEAIHQRALEKHGRGPEGPGPDERMARLEERLDRVERMLHETLERLEQRERAEK